MTEEIISFRDDNGNSVRYRRYAARLPEFLKAYSPKDGYRVETERTDLLSLQKGRLSLMREAVIAGKKPSEVGLPGIESDIDTLVCTAKLLDPQGQVVRSASASMQILKYKDFEVLETAAHQRLLAALGFGGEVFDEDEDTDLRAQGRYPATGDASTSNTTNSDTSIQEDISSVLTHANDDRREHLEADTEQTPVTEAERRQIENLARRAGQPAPVLKTRADAQAARRQLNALERQRRTNERPAQSRAGA